MIPLTVPASLGAIKHFNAKGNDKAAFSGSSAFLAAVLGGAAFPLYPNVLPAMNPAYSLTVENASAGSYGLSVGLIWWSVGILIAIGYFFYLFRTFKGRVSAETETSH